MSRLLSVVYYAVKGAYFVVTQCLVIPVFITLHLLLLPIKVARPSLFWTIDSFLFKAAQGVVTSWYYVEGFTLKESGDILKLKAISNDETLLLCNHQSTADIPIAMLSLYTKGEAAGHVMWIMDHVFRLTHFGWISQCHGDYFLEKPGGTKKERNDNLLKLKKHLRRTYLKTRRKWIFLFPEGGFLSTLKPSSQRYARKHGFPVLENVCLPRLGAAAAVLDELAPKEGSSKIQDLCGKIKWIVDMTIAYPGGEAPNGVALIFSMGRCPPIHIHYRVFEVETVPRDEEGFRDWVFNRYAEKDKMLERFYNSGCFGDNLTEIVESDMTGAFLSVLFFALWALCFSAYVYSPLFSILGVQWILFLVLLYIIYAIYNFVPYFWPTKQPENKCS